MSIPEEFEAAPSERLSGSPGPTEHSTLVGKEVTIQKSPSPQLSQAVQQPLAQISGEEKRETHEHVFTALRSIFEEKAARSPRATEQFIRSYEKIESFLRQHIDSIVQRAKESETGGISISKSETGLPYTLRCLHDKETGEVSFHISFGTFDEGSEAKIKDVYTIDRSGYRSQVQRSKKQSLGGEQRSVSEENSAVGASLLEELSQKGVPGIATQRLLRYTGKRGVKSQSLSERYPSTIYDFLIQRPSKAPFIPPSNNPESYEAWRQNIQIFSGLIRAVTAIHKKGVIHCDLKLENIFLSKEGEPLIGDFGLAVRDKTQMHPRGSPGWVAPEQFGREIVEANSSFDLWSLGSLMFSVVFGTAPFIDAELDIVHAKTEEEAAEKIAKLHQILREKIDYIKASGLHPVIAKILIGLLEPDPQKRMTDEELERAWESGLSLLQTSGPAEHATREDKGGPVQKSPLPQPPQPAQQPPAQVSEEEKKEMYDQVFTSLQSIFEKKWAESPQEREQLLSSYKKIDAFLHEHIDSIVQRAMESETGGISISKSETGLPYTLRCLYYKKTGEIVFHISFGTFDEGGEAKIKEVYTIDTHGHRQLAQRSQKHAQEGKAGQRTVSEEDARTGAALLAELSQKKVPGIATQTLIWYTGKRGMKTPTLSVKYPSTVLNFLVRPENPHPSDEENAAVWSQKMRICSGLIRTVRAMHQNGVIHCDLKPDNIFLSKQGNPVVGDFGLAIRDKTRMRSRGSPGWVAPEQFLSENVVANPALDLWSLGALMFSILFDADPFTAYQEDIVEAKTVEERAQKIEDFRKALLETMDFVRESGLDPQFTEIVTRLLEPDPQKRMTDEELERAWSGKS